MTPPRAVVEAGVAARYALQDACLYWSQVGKCCCSGTPHNEAAQDAAFASAVLAAFFAGEVEGIYTAHRYPTEWWVECDSPETGRELVAGFPFEEMARRVAHALNWEG